MELQEPRIQRHEYEAVLKVYTGLKSENLSDTSKANMEGVLEQLIASWDEDYKLIKEIEKLEKEHGNEPPLRRAQKEKGSLFDKFKV